MKTLTQEPSENFSSFFRLHGSYEALKYGTSLDGLSDLTGGIAENIALRPSTTSSTIVQPNDTAEMLSHLLKLTSIVLCKVDLANNKDVNNSTDSLPKALSEDCYRIYSLHKINLSSGERVHLLRMRSTTHNQGLIKPSLSLLPATLSPAEKQRILALKEDDLDFFLTISDLLKLFSHIEVVHLDADTARDEPSLNGKLPWTLRLYHGRWQKGVSAGGCRNNPDTFHMNPQLSINLAEADEVILALNQHTATDPKVAISRFFLCSKMCIHSYVLDLVTGDRIHWLCHK